jgi:hypothetical protein
LLREAADGDIVITRHGKPAGVLIGFKSDDDWFEYRLQNDSRCSGSKRRVGTCVLAAVFALRTYNVRASLAASNIVPLKGEVASAASRWGSVFNVGASGAAA